MKHNRRIKMNHTVVKPLIRYLPDLESSQSFNFGATFQYLEVSNFLILRSAICGEGLNAFDLVLRLKHLEKFSSSSLLPNLISFLCL